MSNNDRAITLDDTIQQWVIWLVRISIVVAALFSLWQGNWETVFISLLALTLTGLPLAIEHRWRVHLPIEYEFLIIIFIYAGIFLGEAGGAYERFWWWDLVLHISSGVVLAFAGFLILFSLYGQRKLRASPLVLAGFAFSFSLAAGAIWEIFEFAMDNLFGLNMQKNGLRDTMYDLMVDAGGALFIARLSYVYIKTGQGGIFARFVVDFLHNNPQFKKVKKNV